MSETINDVSDPFAIIDAFFVGKSGRFAEHLIDADWKFCTEYRDKIIKSINKNKIIVDVKKLEGEKIERAGILKEYDKFEHQILVKEIRAYSPSFSDGSGREIKIMPNDARIRNYPYNAQIKLDIDHVIEPYDSKGNKVKTIVKRYEGKDAISIGSLPVMIRGYMCNLRFPEKLAPGANHAETLAKLGEDPFELGGYFIIGGREKAIITQENRQDNMVFLYDNTNNADAKYSYAVDIRSKVETYDMAHSVTLFLQHADGAILVQFGSNKYIQMDRQIPLYVIFRALGIISDQEIVEFCLGDPNLRENQEMVEILRVANQQKVKMPKFKEEKEEKSQERRVRSQQEAYAYLASLIQDKMTFGSEKDIAGYVRVFLERHLFPHMGLSFLHKAFFLGYMTEILLQGITGRRKADSIDATYLKRFDNYLVLQSQLLNQTIIHLYDHIETHIKRHSASGKLLSEDDFDDMLPTIMKKLNIESAIEKVYKTGKWTISKSNSVWAMQAVTTQLERKSFIDGVSNLRKVMIPNTKLSHIKKESMRTVSGSQYGYIDTVETPESEKVGVIKHLCLMTNITVGSDARLVIEYIKDYYWSLYEFSQFPRKIRFSPSLFRLFVNGALEGFTEKAQEIVDLLRTLRKQTKMDPHCSISIDYFKKTVWIYTDPGRLIRPLLVVKDGKLVITKKDIKSLRLGELTWDDLLSQGKVEFIDIQESTLNVLLAESPSKLGGTDHELIPYTHCEIHASCTLGTTSALLSLADHNFGPRCIFSSAQIKQALTVYALNFQIRMDKNSYLTWYNERPLIASRWERYINPICAVGGQNVLVAINCYTGYNQEDSVIANESSIERGMFSSTSYKLYQDIALQNQEFMKPDPNITHGMRQGANYDLLNHKGAVPEGTKVTHHDIIIGKTTKMERTEDRRMDEYEFEDSSSELKEDEAVIDRVVPAQDFSGFFINKTRIRETRIFGLGDKPCPCL